MNVYFTYKDNHFDLTTQGSQKKRLDNTFNFNKGETEIRQLRVDIAKPWPNATNNSTNNVQHSL